MRYLIINDDILEIHEDKDSKLIGSVSLKIATVHGISEDRLRIVINSGTSELHFKAPTIAEKIRWEQAITNARNTIMSHFSNSVTLQSADRYRNSVESAVTKKLFNDSPQSDIDKKLADIKAKQASLDETARQLEPLLKLDTKNNPKLTSLVGKLVEVGRSLQETVTECAQDLENNNVRLSAARDETQNNKSMNGGGRYISRGGLHVDFVTPIEEERNHIREIEFNDGHDETLFLSFEQYDDEEETKQNAIELHTGNRAQSNFTRDQANRYENNLENAHLLNDSDARSRSFILQLHEISSKTEKTLHPVIKYLLEKNEAFKGVKFEEEVERTTLPHLVDPNQKIQISELLKLVKDLIGKDLFRFSLPVWINEPLNVLQKTFEQLEYYQILTKANQIQDSCMRLALVCVQAVAPYSAMTDRKKKPFNPLLGETFEYLSPDGSLKFVSEQVSHHPPISAGYAETSDFKISYDTTNNSAFTGNAMDIQPQTSIQVKLNRHMDIITFRRAIITVANIIFGGMYVDNHGDIAFKNHKTGDTAVLHLKRRGWGGKGAFEVEGTVSDKSSKIRYRIQGKWDSMITVTDVEKGIEVFKWERAPFPKNYEQMYYLNRFCLQLNHITPSMFTQIPPTDTRLRPDQRLLEQGKAESATREKNRLEEKQRTVRRMNEKLGLTYKTKWFKEIIDPHTQEKRFEYQGGYWEARKKGDFSNFPDLYSEEPVEMPK